MPGRYSRPPPPDFSPVTAAPEAPRKKKDDPLQDLLRLAGGLAPAAGTAIGAGIGAMGGGIGALPGAAIGGAIGTGLGGAANWGADQMGEGDVQAEEERLAREEERKARALAAQQVLGNLG